MKILTENIIIKALFSYHSLSIPKEKIEEKIMGHYDYPSILSLQEGLESLDFSTMPIHIKSDRLDKVPFPCIAHFKNNTFILLKKYENDFVYYLTETNQSIKEHILDFEKKWSGAILLISPNASLKENKEYKSSFFSRLLLIKSLSIVCFFLFLFQIVQVGLFFSIVFFVKLIGLGISIILLQAQIGDDSILQRLCNTNKNTDCESVLSSGASKLNRWLSWSDMGFFYFGGSVFTLFLVSFQHKAFNIFPYFLFLNLLALPYSFFSVYYQWKIIKKWCLLCLSVQCLFWIEFIILFNVWSFPFFDLPLLLSGLFGFLVPALFWLFFSEIIKKSYTNDVWKIRACGYKTIQKYLKQF
ncbi:MAG: hypothetical protein EAZ20_10905 [Bacteroidetes bacterium]|nr:MAG: hypothetical protein EAZ20_10905 [Bacteroidota bacterium]